MNLGGRGWDIWQFRGGKDRSEIDTVLMYEVLNNTNFFQLKAIYLLYSILCFLKENNEEGGRTNISEENIQSCKGTVCILNALLHKYIVCFQELNIK